MHKSKIAIVTALIAATTVQSAEARGFRIGLGFGVPLGIGYHRPAGADYSPARHEEATERRRAAAAVAAKARADRAAEAEKTKRAARLAAEAKASADLAARNSQHAKAVALAKPADAGAPVGGAGISTPQSRTLEEAQDAQTRKADQIAQRVGLATTKPALPATVAPGRSGDIGKSGETGTPVPAKVTAPQNASPAVAPARPASNGDCKRFIAGAGITVSVPCNE